MGLAWRVFRWAGAMLILSSVVRRRYLLEMGDGDFGPDVRLRQPRGLDGRDHLALLALDAFGMGRDPAALGGDDPVVGLDLTGVAQRIPLAEDYW